MTVRRCGDSPATVYQQRIVAYADILGWRSVTNIRGFDFTFGVLKSIEKYTNNFSLQAKEALSKSQGISERVIQEHHGIEFSSFSDCFAVSAPITSGRLIFKILAFASHELLRKELLLRGGVTVGKLHHCQKIILGPALIEAVEIEEMDAIYPRLLCSKQLIQFLDDTDYKNKVVLKDCCEDWVANVALGSSHAQDDLMNCINKWLRENEAHEIERVIRKWHYLQKMLPIMYEHLK